MECSICFEILGDVKYQSCSEASVKVEIDKRLKEHRSSPRRKNVIYNLLFGKRSSSSSSLEELISTGCGHVFHRRCIKAWLRRGGRSRHCPICRKSISSESELRTIFLSIQFERCKRCIEWQKNYKTLEEVHQHQCEAYSRQLENVQEDLRKSAEVNEQLEYTCREIQSKLEIEMELATVQVKTVQNSYDALLKDFETLREKYEHLLRNSPPAPAIDTLPLNLAFKTEPEVPDNFQCPIIGVKGDTSDSYYGYCYNAETESDSSAKDDSDTEEGSYYYYKSINSKMPGATSRRKKFPSLNSIPILFRIGCLGPCEE